MRLSWLLFDFLLVDGGIGQESCGCMPCTNESNIATLVCSVSILTQVLQTPTHSPDLTQASFLNFFYG